MKEKQKRMKGKGEEDGHGNWAEYFTSLLLYCVSISREKEEVFVLPCMSSLIGNIILLGLGKLLSHNSLEHCDWSKI
jgi:hypothetical protein